MLQNFPLPLYRSDVVVLLLKNIMCFNPKIFMSLIFKKGNNHIQLLTVLVKT